MGTNECLQSRKRNGVSPQGEEGGGQVELLRGGKGQSQVSFIQRAGWKVLTSRDEKVNVFTSLD